MQKLIMYGQQDGETIKVSLGRDPRKFYVDEDGQKRLHLKTKHGGLHVLADYHIGSWAFAVHPGDYKENYPGWLYQYGNHKHAFKGKRPNSDTLIMSVPDDTGIIEDNEED